MSDFDALSEEVESLSADVRAVRALVRHGVRKDSPAWLPLLWEGDQA